jgi:hypothetical protein
LSPTPFTRFWKSAQSLNSPLARSAMMVFDMAGPTPFTESSAAASALLTSTWANAMFTDARNTAIASNSFLIISFLRWLVEDGRRRPLPLTDQYARR